MRICHPHGVQGRRPVNRKKRYQAKQRIIRLATFLEAKTSQVILFRKANRNFRLAFSFTVLPRPQRFQHPFQSR